MFRLGWWEGIATGRLTLNDVKNDVLKATPNELASALRPEIGLAVGVLGGATFFPDVTEPRKVRDKWEFAFNTLRLGGTYRMLTGKPTKGNAFVHVFLNPKTWTGVNAVDVGQSNYQEMYGLARDWLKKHGVTGGSAGYSPRNNALYHAKYSAMIGDEESALHFLADYGLMGGTDQSLAQSLRMLEPTSGMTDGQRKEFIKGLAPIDQDRLRRAYTHYAGIVEQISDKPIKVDDLADRDIYRFVNILQRRTEVKLKALRTLRKMEKRNPEIREARRKAQRERRR